MNAEQNELITRITPGTPCGQLMRQYWQAAALVDEFNPALDPRMEKRPVKAVKLLGQDLVLFKDASGAWGLLDRDCAHRGADLSFGRLESLAQGGGLRCPFHCWKFAADGRCLETPAEPAGSKLCERIKQRSYPVIEKSGALFAWLGDEATTPPPFPPLTASPPPPATALPSRACGAPTGCKPLRWALIRRIPHSCSAFCRTSLWTRSGRMQRASNFAAPMSAPSMASSGP